MKIEGAMSLSLQQKKAMAITFFVVLQQNKKKKAQ
jgi:hypothetical protein